MESFNDEAELARGGRASCSFGPGEQCRYFTERAEALQFRRDRLVSANESEQFGRLEESLAAPTGRPLGAVPAAHFLVLAEPFGDSPDSTGLLQTEVDCQRGDGVLAFE